MSVGTLILATLIAGAVYVVRSHGQLIASAWREARWYEKAGLLLALLPIPGPFEEAVGVLVIRRIVQRRRNAAV